MSREDVRPCTAVQTLEVGEFSMSGDQGAEGTSCSATLATGNVLEVVPDDESVECLSSSTVMSHRTTYRRNLISFQQMKRCCQFIVACINRLEPMNNVGWVVGRVVCVG